MADTDRRVSSDPIEWAATTSEEVSAMLIKFASKWDDGQQYITDLAGILSTITTLLRELPPTNEPNTEDCKLKTNVIRILCEGIKADLISAAQALHRAELRAGPGRFVASRRTGFPVVHPRPHGVALLRAEVESDPLIFDRLADAKNHLWYLYEGFRYLKLRKLQKE
jgi:hypothetical protein